MLCDELRKSRQGKLVHGPGKTGQGWCAADGPHVTGQHQDPGGGDRCTPSVTVHVVALLRELSLVVNQDIVYVGVTVPRNTVLAIGQI